MTMADIEEKQEQKQYEQVSQEYQTKIEAMRKCVPFLSKIIENMQHKEENEGETAQMQMLQKILLCTEKRVSIEELNECKETLEKIYEIYAKEAEAKIATETKIKFLAIKERTSSTEKLSKSPTREIRNTIVEPSKLGNEKESNIILRKIENDISRKQEEYDVNKGAKEEKLVSNTVDLMDKSIEKEQSVLDNIEQIIDEEITLLNKEIQNTTEGTIVCDNTTEKKIKRLNVTKKNNQEKTEDKTNEFITSRKTQEEKQNNREKGVLKKLTHTFDIGSEQSDITKSDNAKSELQIAIKDQTQNSSTGKEVYDSKRNHDISGLNCNGTKKNQIVKFEKEPTEIATTELRKKTNAKNEKENIVENFKKIETSTITYKLNHEIKERNVENENMYDKKKTVDENETNHESTNIDEDEDDDEIEENVELIKIPEGEDEQEMILPDSADERGHLNDTSDGCDELHKKRDFFKIMKGNKNKSEFYETRPELKEKDNTNKFVKEVNEESRTRGINRNSRHNKLQTYDPLHCDEHDDREKIDEDDNNDKVKQAEQEDDDDVEIIETRNSPICIASDTDNEELKDVQSNNSPDDIQLNALPKTFARKSTTGVKRCPVTDIQTRPKNVTYLLKNKQPFRKHILDTIELLDSSDDESKDKPQEGKKTNSSARRKHRKVLPTHHQASEVHIVTVGETESVITPRPSIIPVTTQQTNFLNAINLQPTVPSDTCGNPQAFLTTMLNKKVMIPNAFFGNKRTNSTATSKTSASTRSSSSSIALRSLYLSKSQRDAENEKSDRHWLENFLTQFSNSQQYVHKPSFMLLQPFLRNNRFTSIHRRRAELNANAHIAVKQMNGQMLMELRNIFYVSDGYNNKELSVAGHQLCSLAHTITGGKVVPLITDARTGRVTASTRSKQSTDAGPSVQQQSQTTTASTRSSGNVNQRVALSSTTAAVSSSLLGRKRRKEDVEYTPDKAVSIMDGALSNERKRSLRTKRPRRYDEDSFTQDFQMDSDSSQDSYIAVLRKVEQKRLEAKRQREEQVKSFENAFIEAFGKQNDFLRDNAGSVTSRQILKRMRDEDVRKFAAHADVENLLTPTWIDDSSSEKNTLKPQPNEEPKEHFIYKVIPTTLIAAKIMNITSKIQEDPKQQPEFPLKAPQEKQETMVKKRGRPRKQKLEEEPEIITCDDLEETTIERASHSASDDVVICEDNASTHKILENAPKNINPAIHSLNRENEWCALCKHRTPRIVHHYVNDHRGSEVYNSRLSVAQIQSLRQHDSQLAELHIYKNGQQQFETQCIFCQKNSRFMLPYWYQHFSMHTGEYAYRCSGCGIRKPTRSLLTSHVNMPCPSGGKLQQDFIPDSKPAHIMGHICTLCNYVQLYRQHVIRHLNLEHDICHIKPQHIQSIVLLQVPKEALRTTTSSTVTYEVDDINDTEQDSNHDDNSSSQAGQWDDGEPDLSFMICGMLDVEMKSND